MCFSPLFPTNVSPCCAYLEPPGCFDHVLLSVTCLDYSNDALKITVSVQGYVLKGLSCTRRERHAGLATAFSGRWWKPKTERGLSQNSTGFGVESVIKTYFLKCCVLTQPYMAVFPESYGADRQNGSSTFTRVSVFGESTTARCQWLADRRAGWVCLPRSSVFLSVCA